MMFIVRPCASKPLRLSRPVRKIKRVFLTLLRDSTGVAATEFAFVGPIFFLLIFAILEVPLIGWNHEGLSRAAANAREYMETQSMARAAVDYTTLRKTVCDSLTVTTLSCDPAKLKMNIYEASTKSDKAIRASSIPALITTEVDNGKVYSADSYIIVLAYDWSGLLPTSKLFLPHDDTTTQIQATSFVLLSQRPYDNIPN